MQTLSFNAINGLSYSLPPTEHLYSELPQARFCGTAARLLWHRHRNQPLLQHQEWVWDHLVRHKWHSCPSQEKAQIHWKESCPSEEKAQTDGTGMRNVVKEKENWQFHWTSSTWFVSRQSDVYTSIKSQCLGIHYF